MRPQGAALLVLAWIGCGPRSLELVLSIDATCAVAIPAGASLFYEIVSAGVDGGAPPRVCGSCLAVDTALASDAALLTFLRSRAPACPIQRDTALTAQVTSYADAACASKPSTPAASLCAASAPIVAGDGHGDQSVALALSCAAGCNATSCVPVACVDQNKDCGPTSDGCGHMLDCGSCRPPQRCGGGGTPNVCSK